MKITSIDRSSRNITKTSTFKNATTHISYKFDSEKEFNAFASLFPKYCKIVCSGMSYTDESKNYEFGVHIYLTTPLNNVTGSVNETAEKRVNKIKQVLSTIKGA